MSFKRTTFRIKEKKEYFIEYKDIILPHKFYADFVVYDDIILEVKAIKEIVDVHIAQTLNYVRLTNGRLGVIVNFSNKSLEHKRVVR